MNVKCGKCGTIYPAIEHCDLKQIKVISSKGGSFYGFHHQCDCGYIFGHDRWRLIDKFIIPELKIGLKLSTVFLEYESPVFYANSSRIDSMYYETILRAFQHKGREDDKVIFNIRSGFQMTYETKSEARKGHNCVKRIIKNKEFVFKTQNPLLENDVIKIILFPEFSFWEKISFLMKGTIGSSF